MKRDKQLDLYRGLSMIYVVCFIHVMYWLKIGTEPLNSFILVEMPLIFFISGASLSVSKSSRSFVQTVQSRIKRVLIPYYIYAFMMVFIVALLSVVWYFWYPQIEHIFGIKVASKYMFNITTYRWNDIFAILSCSNIPQSPCVWHLWFILPYLILSCTFEIQKKALDRVNKGGYCIMCIVAFAIISAITNNFLLRYIFCYNIFMVIGFCYYKNIKIKRIVIVGVISVLIVAFLCWQGAVFCPMQNHKFPPDFLFVAYNLIFLCVVSLLFSRIVIPEFKILQLWNERGYTLYLYQSIVFFVVFAIHLAVINKISNNFIQAVLCIIIMFFLSTCVSYITYPLERLIMKQFHIIK